MKMDNYEDIKIVRDHRLGQKRTGNTTKTRAIIVKLHWYADRLTVWKAKRNLKGTKVFVNQDFPKEIQERRKILWPIMMKAKEAKKDAFLNVNTLMVDNKAYNVQKIHTLPAELNPSKIATPAIGDNMMAFFWWPVYTE